MIKPIETIYNGYRFRSRLEARWAVFFDVLEIKYEYEKEGFDLGKYGWYLPDFWLPTQRWWLEIKPALSNFDPEDYWADHPCFDLDTDSFAEPLPGGRFAVITGEPWAEFGYFDTIMEYAVTVIGDNNYRWCECLECGKINLQYMGYSERNCNCFNYRVGGDLTPNLKRAYQAARQARFEHGETPLVILKN